MDGRSGAGHRDHRADGGALDAGQRGDALDDAIDRGGANRVVAVGARRQRQVDDQQVAWLESRRYPRQRAETAQQQSGADQQHQCQRDLRDHQRRPHAAMADAARSTPALFVERFPDIESGGLPGRHGAEDQAGDHREREGEQHHRPVDGNAVRARQRRDRRGRQERHQPHRQQQSAQPASAGEHQAFDHQLPDDARATGADRQPDGHFLLPADRAREQQVGHIGARDQQHQRHGAEQHQQRRANVLHDLILRAVDQRADVLVGRLDTLPRAGGRWCRARRAPARS